MKVNMITPMLDLCFKAHDSLLIGGLHGIGKTQIVEEWCGYNNYHCTVLQLSSNDVGDVIGIPVTETLPDGTKITVWTRPSWLHEMHEESKKGRHCVLFLDELNRAQPDVLQPMLQLVQKGVIHTHKLPVLNGIRTLIVAAVNPEGGTGNYQVNTLDPAMRDRFLEITAEADATAWLEWARKKNVAKVVRDFIAEYPQKLHHIPSDSMEKGATPRAWEMFAEHLKVLGPTPDEVVLYAAAEGRIGPAIAGQFLTFFKNHNDIVGADDVAKLVRSKKTEPIEKIGEAVASLMDGMEAIQKHEVCANLVDMFERAKANKKSEMAFVMLAYLYGLEREIKVSILKKLKTENTTLYGEIVKHDTELTNKGLFRAIAYDGNGFAGK